MGFDLKPPTAFQLLELAFLATYAWFSLKQVRKDLNGLGKKVREDRRLEEQRNLAISLMLLVQEESKAERWKIAEKILESNRGNNGA